MSHAAFDLEKLSQRRLALILCALLLLQALLWIGLPLLFEGAIRVDVAEGAIDGPEWQLSYLRHPPFSTWLTGLASTLGPHRYAAVYAIGFVLASGACAIVAVFLSRVDRPASGLVALLAGLASPYATYVPVQVNHNIGLMPFWAATLAAAWFAFEGGTLGPWAAFGLVVGLGLWAKYAILHLVGPLGLLFLILPQWRRQLLTPGPWLAALLATAIVAPQLVDVLRKGSTTLQFATHTTPSSFPVRIAWVLEFALDAALAQVSMFVLALAACGRRPLLAALRAMLSPAADRFDLYVHAAAFGPALVILAAALLGVRPHYLWLTAPSLSFALWWGRAAGRAGFLPVANRVFPAFAALAALFVTTYVAVREIAPHVSRPRLYADTDGPALAALAQHYWAQGGNDRIPYIVTLDFQHGEQAGGSIVFDLPYRVQTLEDGDPTRSPWIQVADLKRRGALVVATQPMADGLRVLGVRIERIEEFDRPILRGGIAEPIYFGVLPPGS